MKSSYRYKSRHHIALTRKDADSFSDALRAEFPTIRFLPANLSEPWIDHEASREQVRLRSAGTLPPETPSNVMRHPGNDSLRCLSSLGDATRPTIVWIEPRGWRPRWSPAPNREGVYILINTPRLLFEFTRSRFVLESSSNDPWHRPRAFDDPPDGISENEILTLSCMCMVGYYRLDHKDHQAFLRRVWRILDKHTTTELAHCDLKTREPIGVSSSRSVWAGFDALAWMRRDPRHFIWGGGVYFRPPESAKSKR